jgi:hypothetical protein
MRSHLIFFSDILCSTAKVSKELTDSFFRVPPTRQYILPQDRNIQLVDLVAKLYRKCLYSELPSNSRVYLSCMLLRVYKRHGRGHYCLVSKLLSLKSYLVKHSPFYIRVQAQIWLLPTFSPPLQPRQLSWCSINQSTDWAPGWAIPCVSNRYMS